MSSMSIHEIAAGYTNSIIAQLNQVASELAGTDVLWFRLIPDKKNHDVIFQSYTLYGVEDCPLEFKAIYSDTGYDDAAITFNIMGLEYSVPLTLEISLDVWHKATNFDGTIPQRGDIVFIPISNRLLEVVSMMPAKKLAGQMTGFKVNLKIYEPKRSVLVGENLKASIENNTVNLDSRFGDEIEKTLKNIIDPDQFGLLNATDADAKKKITKQSDNNGIRSVSNIITRDLRIGEHIVSKTQYNMNISNEVVVSYSVQDSIDEESERNFSCWFKLNKNDDENIINVQKIIVNENKMELKTTKKIPLGSKVILERGLLSIPCTVISMKPYTVETELVYMKKLMENNPVWNELPGFTIREADTVNLLTGNGDKNICIDILGGSFIIVSCGDKVNISNLNYRLKPDTWYGISLNMNEFISCDIFSDNDGIKKISNIKKIRNRGWYDINITDFCIKSSNSEMTNIRFYNVSNEDIDKQITDLLTYNISNDSNAIINDSADAYLNKKYIGLKG